MNYQIMENTENFDILKKCPLFTDIDNQDLYTMLNCLEARKVNFEKGEYVLNAGDTPENIGIVLSGEIRIVRDDFWGNRMILTQIIPGNLFGEAFACAKAGEIPFSAVAHENSEILMINYRKIITTCQSACGFHSKLIRNMLSILANKNMMLTRKMEHITKKTTREKVMSYLSEQAVAAGKNSFEIPFNRQELSDYLSVERSALSLTLGKMKQEQIIEFNKNKFTVL